MWYHITSYQTKTSPFTPLLIILHHFFNFLSLYLYGNLITLLIIFIFMKRILLSFLLTRKTAPAKSVFSNGRPVKIVKVNITFLLYSFLLSFFSLPLPPTLSLPPSFSLTFPPLLPLLYPLPLQNSHFTSFHHSYLDPSAPVWVNTVILSGGKHSAPGDRFGYSIASRESDEVILIGKYCTPLHCSFFTVLFVLFVLHVLLVRDIIEVKEQ